VLDLVSESGSFLLNSGDVSLEFTSDTLEFANDGLLDSLGEGRVLVSEDFVVVANFVENLLPSSFTEETMTLVERYLDSLVEGEGRLAGGMFDVSETLEEDGIRKIRSASIHTISFACFLSSKCKQSEYSPIDA